METDLTLLKSAKTMDKEALVKIFDLYSPALYKYALRLCGDAVKADHIVGDVFAKLLDQLAAGKGPDANLRSYLFQSTYHQMIDEARTSRRSVSLEVLSWLRQDVDAMPFIWEDQDLFKQVLHVLQNRLSEDQRHVIVLRFFEGFSIRETATILGKREDHVRVIQNRALKLLRRIFDPREATPRVEPVSKALGA